MKILDQINDTTLKVAKGFLAIFVLKVFLLCGVLIFQSCEVDSNKDYETSQKEIAIDNFEKLVSSNASNIEGYVNNERDLFLARNSNKGKSTELD
ncbi:MAG: hypothetical protein P8K68_12110 [Algibacter sp.]|uniref:hypothetical protein n=1 Tax=Algibacter sp. TaxID=1872428 RepID=UPI002627DD9C|nr:hypothetical protein [Algibacter sp.]MDG1729636.1 hypothetical protein [Algibacter sp.]MDG2179512.1 hypothetical protein [Algibacter sp.]